jgi:pimeloyl-ACP methyl ester carboxylesterase
MDFYSNFVNNHQPKYVIVNGQKRKYLTGGGGKIGFLVLPGSGQDALSCFDLIDKFENKYKVIAINYTGLTSLGNFYTYVNLILKKEKIEKIVLYGMSLGGFLAQHYIRKFPNNVTALILSHTGSTKSKTIKNKVSIPGKILYKFIPLIPQFVLDYFFNLIAGKVQTGQSNISQLYKKYSSQQNLERRKIFIKNSTFSLINKEYLKTVYLLGVKMEKVEKKFSNNDLKNWKGKILIIKTNNDPLAQDNGMFKYYYPNASVYTFEKTGHLTPFIQFAKMVQVIEKFLNNTH